MEHLQLCLLFLTIIYIEKISKKFLSQLNLARAQIIYAYKTIRIIVIDNYPNFIHAIF